MEYERIHKPQSGLISPSKLRMKLVGSQNQIKKDGSNSNSARTSPSKLHDSEFVKDGLLSLQDENFCDQGSVALSEPYSVRLNKPNESLQREIGDTGGVKMPQITKAEGGNSSTVHPMRSVDDENLDYDSNASSSSFEFHKEDNNRSVHNPISRSFQRSIPSKWNNAEKWIMNRHNSSSSNRTGAQTQSNRLPATNTVKVAPEYVYNDHKLLVNRIAQTKRVDFCQPVSQMGLDKFSFVPEETQPMSSQAIMIKASTGTSVHMRELHEVDHHELASATDSSAGIPMIRSVSMRDMGTEMTPIASQEPSRTGTPVGATTPLRSPTSSVPSTPRPGEPASTPFENTTHIDSSCTTENNGKKQLSEQDMKRKTRREIVALGVQLGKTNIAAWASKDEKEKSKNTDRDELDHIEFERRALVWEEVEKSRHTARYKREEIKIEAWESQQKAKLEAEMRRIEAKVEQMRAQAEAKMVKTISITRQRSEEKRAEAEAKKNAEAARATAQADYIRQTGQFPSSPFICCGWFR